MTATGKDDRCPLCHQKIRKVRSTDISTHFHAHITEMARETAQDRDYVYQVVLLLACDMQVDGGSPYPFTIVKDMLYPKRTSNRTNRQMMTAIEAAHMKAAEWGITLNESPERWLEDYE